jgi:hypothetical protein
MTIRRVIMCAGVAVLVGMGLAARSFLSANAPPAIEFPSALQLGELDLGKIATGRLAIANRGGSALRIGSVRTSCSCSGVEREVDGDMQEVTALTIPPGESVDLQVRVAARGIPGQPMRTVLGFRTNDPCQPEGRIDIVVSRIRGLVSTPAAVVFGLVILGRDSTQVVAVRDSEGKPLLVENATTFDHDRLVARVLPSAGPKDGASADGGCVEVTARAAAVGTVQGNVQIQVSVAGERRFIAIPVTARIVAPVEACPNRICLPRASAEGPLYHMTCLCRSASDQALTLTTIEVPAPIAVTIQKGDGATRLVRIEWRRSGEKEASRQHLVRLRAETEGRCYTLEIRADCKPPEG